MCGIFNHKEHEGKYTKNTEVAIFDNLKEATVMGAELFNCHCVSQLANQNPIRILASLVINRHVRC